MKIKSADLLKALNELKGKHEQTVADLGKMTQERDTAAQQLAEYKTDADARIATATERADNAQNALNEYKTDLEERFNALKGRVDVLDETVEEEPKA